MASEKAAKPGGPWRKLIATVVFLAIVAALVALLSAIFTPSFVDAREDCIHKIYDQPQDTVQVACVGSSTVLCGISPDYLFENYGIAAYNACTSQQPMITSLYVLKDLMRSQSGSVNTVIVDVTGLMGGEDEATYAERGLAQFVDMRPSLVKLEYLLEVANAYEGINVLEELIPVLKYHSRWTELNDLDFGLFPYDDHGNYTHGQLIWRRSYESNASQGRADEFTTKNNESLTAERSFNEDDLTNRWNTTSVRYLEEMIDYCTERGVRVLLVKTPASEWTDFGHDSIALFAEQNGVEFLDMSFIDVLEDCGLSYAADYYDGHHVNAIGSEKVSRYLGKYLKDNYDLADFRDDARYSFMTSDLEEYHKAMKDAALMECSSFEEYLDLLDCDEYTVFISAKGESADGLSTGAREKLGELGLEKLSSLAPGESYVGVLSGGARLSEKVSAGGDKVSIRGAYKDGSVVLAKQSLQSGAKIDQELVMTSVGADKKAEAVIKISGKDLSENMDGINFVVFNSKSGFLLDTSCFDTHGDCARTSDIADRAGQAG